MTYRVLIATGLVFLSAHAQALPDGAAQPLPLKDGRPAVAMVGEDPISLDEFTSHLDPPVDLKRLMEGRGTVTELELLERLISVRLIALEGAAMGLGDLPEIRKQVDVESRTILREVLRESVVKDLKPDESAVEARFRELVREYRTASLLFDNEEAASTVREKIAGGGDFAEIAARALADKAASTEGDDEYHRLTDFVPGIAEAVAKLEVGQTSPLIRIEAGFVVVKLVDIRHPENPEAREQARRLVLREQQQAAIRAYEEGLRKRYVVVNKPVLDSVDYEATDATVEAFLADTRVVAEVEGASPVTVGELTDDLRMQSFHRADEAGHRKRLNARKEAALEAMTQRRALNTEALRLGIDKTSAYVDRVNAFEESLVFNAVVQKVVTPDSKMREEEVKAYYDAHRAEYSYPAMMRIRSLAFSERGAAEAATEKLRAGTDFSWLASTADHQVDKAAKGLLTFDTRPVTVEAMPEGLQKALADTKAGDVRLYASPEGHFYALAVQEVVSPAARPYDEVKAEIAKKLYGEKLKKGVEDYAAKLRALSKVEVYLKKVD